MQDNIFWHHGAVSCMEKERKLKQGACCVWLTGLSGSGKSTVACTLDHLLFQMGASTFLLDGDNVR